MKTTPIISSSGVLYQSGRVDGPAEALTNGFEKYETWSKSHSKSGMIVYIEADGHILIYKKLIHQENFEKVNIE